MATILGSGPFRYELVEGWGQLPDGWTYKEVASVGVDKRDQVYVFSRGEHPVIVFDRHGKFLKSWGEGTFKRAHGVTMGPDESIYLTDDGDHTVRKCTLDGKVLLQLGIPDKPAPYQSGEPFNRCTHVALSPKNEIYVSDGYGNSRVHKYSPNGKLLFSWGEPGSDPGQFNIVHNICTDKDGWVYVADRENHRIQIFDDNGKYETQWNNMHRPCALYMDTTGSEPTCYVGELGPGMTVNKESPNLGNRVDIYNKEGKRLARLGDIRGGEAPGQFIAPHGIAMDSRGDLYVGEVSWTIMGQHLKSPRELRSLQKLRRLS
ncbi:MAG TPA: peptidyl-alpha-hydroxyglycine alpha-amidating lyase family protein [Terriglobales bacterium]|nr:peptidyl-alpha-hydroxyglycine alpha-amidating lyase family protein [Terriglobales bacterium]